MDLDALYKDQTPILEEDLKEEKTHLPISDEEQETEIPIAGRIMALEETIKNTAKNKENSISKNDTHAITSIKNNSEAGSQINIEEQNFIAPALFENSLKNPPSVICFL